MNQISKQAIEELEKTFQVEKELLVESFSNAWRNYFTGKSEEKKRTGGFKRNEVDLQRDFGEELK